MHARISVAIPVFRPRPEHLGALLDSLDAQTVPPLEVILSEDPCDDGSGPAVPSHLASGAPIKCSRNPQRLGMVGNWNRAVELCAGDAVLMMGQDDVLLPNACEAHIGVLQETPALPASASLPDFIDDSGARRAPDQRSVGVRRLIEPGARYRLPYDALAGLALLYGNVTGEPCGTCFRMDAWTAVGGYSDSFRHSADIDFMLRVARECGPIQLSTVALSARRLHAGSATVEHIAERVTAADRERLLSDHRAALTEPGLRRRAEARLVTHNLFDALRTHDLARLRSAGFSARLTGAVGADLWENLGGRPRGRELMERCREQ
jgi:glycosyltransferase involved in cell wall biosynthesis